MAVLDAAPRLRIGLDLPRRNLRAGFSMTAMADVLFQLLIFFMLSANLSSYGLLDIRSGALAGGGGATDAPQAGRVTPAGTTAVWTLAPDRITAGGQRFALTQLDRLAEALVTQGTTDVLLVLRQDVPVGRVVAVLEALQARGIVSVQIADGGGA
ncbi:ExbD/TolR family protein [Paracoccus sp. ME4]|uniref:ExbD/TolR family protein n=1 Tax=Paracoccus sp. ME4 TaxID=3138066 RepID=UPI00398BBAB3